MTESPWHPIAAAPKDATWIEVKMDDGTVLQSRWEDGWVIDDEGHLVDIPEPLEWRPL